MSPKSGHSFNGAMGNINIFYFHLVKASRFSASIIEGKELAVFSCIYKSLLYEIHFSKHLSKLHAKLFLYSSCSFSSDISTINIVIIYISYSFIAYCISKLL